MTPHDSTRCAVCAYEGGDHAYWCEAHLRPAPTEGVGAVAWMTPLGESVITARTKSRAEGDEEYLRKVSRLHNVPLYAAPVPSGVTEAIKFAMQVLDEQATISRTMAHLNGSITEHAQAVGLDAMHKPAHGVSIALRRLTAALAAAERGGG